jgi:DNA polymerase I-like protein with 3'-5' exonuclease and polymerase domains
MQETIKYNGIDIPIYYNPEVVNIKLKAENALDIETTGLKPFKAKTRLITINTGDCIYALNTEFYSDAEIKSIIKPNLLFIAHNAKFDASFLLNQYGVKTNWFCTMLAAQILTMGSESYSHSLLDVIETYLGLRPFANIDKKDMQLSFTNNLNQPITHNQIGYACLDVYYLLELKKVLSGLLSQYKFNNIASLEFALIYPLLNMQLKGCLFDVNKHRKHIKEWQAKYTETTILLDKEVVTLFDSLSLNAPKKYVNERTTEVVKQLDIFGGVTEIKSTNNNNINYGSNQQLHNLFVQLEQPLPILAGKVSYSEDSLNEYLTENPASIMATFIKLILERVKLNKVINTYGEKLIAALDSDGRLRTEFVQIMSRIGGSSVGTATGRLASRNFNIANIPKDNNVREAFVADPGYSFVDCDMTGQEVAIAAVYSKDPLLLSVFTDKFDHHSYLATISFSIIFNVDMDNRFKCEVDKSSDLVTYKSYTGATKTVSKKKLRDDHKQCLFAIIYGAGANRIYKVLAPYINFCYDGQERTVVAETVTKALKSKLKKLDDWLKTRVKLVKKDGYLVTSVLGRKRFFDDSDSAYGDAMNCCIQGTGAEAMKMLILSIYNQLNKWSFELKRPVDKVGWLVFSVYDQAVVSLADDLLYEADGVTPSLYVKTIQNLTKQSLQYFLQGMIEADSDVQITKYWKK